VVPLLNAIVFLGGTPKFDIAKFDLKKNFDILNR